MTRTKHIALDTANKMLPLLKSIATEVKALWREIRAAKHVLSTDMDMNAEEQDSMREELQKGVDRLTEVLDEIERLGCAVESYSEGVIDIPSVLEGREILLCWKCDEDEIRHYHLPGEGFDNRVLINPVLE